MGATRTMRHELRQLDLTAGSRTEPVAASACLPGWEMKMLRSVPVSCLVLLLCVPVWAQTVQPDLILVSTESSAELDSVTTTDRDINELTVASSTWRLAFDLAAILPTGTDVDAISLLPNGDIVFSTETGFRHGPLVVADEDLVLYSGGILSMLFDADAGGMPASADVDAIHVVALSPLDFYFSLETPAVIDGTSYSDDDVVRYSGSTYSLAYAGALILDAEAARADIDGLHVDGGSVLISTDVSIANVDALTAADDEDILEYRGGALSLCVDMSAHSVDSATADIDALTLVISLFADGFESGNTNAWSASIP